MLKLGNISEKDLDLFYIVDTAEEAIDYLNDKLKDNQPNF